MPNVAITTFKWRFTIELRCEVVHVENIKIFTGFSTKEIAIGTVKTLQNDHKVCETATNFI